MSFSDYFSSLRWPRRCQTKRLGLFHLIYPVDQSISSIHVAFPFKLGLFCSQLYHSGASTFRMFFSVFLGRFEVFQIKTWKSRDQPEKRVSHQALRSPASNSTGIFKPICKSSSTFSLLQTTLNDLFGWKTRDILTFLKTLLFLSHPSCFSWALFSSQSPVIGGISIFNRNIVTRVEASLWNSMVFALAK